MTVTKKEVEDAPGKAGNAIVTLIQVLHTKARWV
jgi:hypothetical protein